MARSVADRLSDVHPKPLRVGGERDHKKLAVAKDVERALEVAGISKQEAAYQLGYADPGVVSRWCSGVERPLFDKLFALDGFLEAFIQVLAQHSPTMEVETLVRIRRRA